jgi:tRNA(Ile)-lysidine synthase TilS/MesJ
MQMITLQHRNSAKAHFLSGGEFESRGWKAILRPLLTLPESLTRAMLLVCGIGVMDFHSHFQLFRQQHRLYGSYQPELPQAQGWLPVS